jgi:hypothetical protein
VTLRCAAPYGLLSVTRQLQFPGEVVVFPKVYSIDSPASAGVDMIAGGRFRGGRRVNSGTQFAGVRSWQSGDSFKQIHWKSTARRSELMVKSFEEELAGRISLLLDCAPDDTAHLDNAVRAAASLGVASLQEGHHLEFIEAPDQPTLRLAPFMDESEFLERLARYTPPAKSTEIDLQDFWRKSAIALVGTRWQPWWEELIIQSEHHRRHVHIYLPQGATVGLRLSAEIHFFGENGLIEDLGQFAR